MTHNHLHNHCEHCLHYCGTCNKTYCCKCSQEWGQNYNYPYYYTWTSPTYVPCTTTGLGLSGNGSYTAPTCTSNSVSNLTNCSHEHIK